MSRWMARLRDARASGDPTRLLAEVPYAATLGVQVEAIDGELVGHMPFAPSLVGDSSIPALHGGTIGALLELVSIVTVGFSLETDAAPRIVNLTVEYLRSGRARDTYAVANVTRAGRRVVAVRATAWQDDRDAPIAAASLHLLLRPPTA